MPLSHALGSSPPGTDSLPGARHRPFTADLYRGLMREIVTALQAEVDRLPTGARLPSEHELMARFGASRSTVRRAIEQLEARFLVRRVHGSGTYVHRRIDYLVSAGLAPSLHATIEKTGATARTILLDARTEPAPETVAERLNVDVATPCTRLLRAGHIDDEPATCVEEWLPPGILDYAEVSLRAIESLAEILRASERDPVRSWSRVSTEFPSRTPARSSSASCRVC